MIAAISSRVQSVRTAAGLGQQELRSRDGWRSERATTDLIERWSGERRAEHPPHSHTQSITRAHAEKIFLSSEQKIGMQQSHWDALGGPDAAEMENAGVAQICRAYRVPYLSLRALSDVREGDANADFNAFASKAADNLYTFVAHVVQQYALPPPPQSVAAADDKVTLYYYGGFLGRVEGPMLLLEDAGVTYSMDADVSAPRAAEAACFAPPFCKDGDVHMSQSLAIWHSGLISLLGMQ